MFHGRACESQFINEILNAKLIFLPHSIQLALGAYTDPRGLESERAQRDLATAKALTYTCYQVRTVPHY